MSTIAHGGIDHAEIEELGLDPAVVLDFSSNINPFGPPPAVRRALAGLDPAPYPDRSSTALRRALAAHYGQDAGACLPGNGSLELIHLIARALLHPGDRAMVVEPVFGEYAHASRLAGAMVIAARSAEKDGFAVNIPALAGLVALHRPRLVWLCNPNNPTGVMIGQHEVEILAGVCREAGGILVLDAAYAEMARESSDRPDTMPAGTELLLLHSLTKAYALAGLRLGCLFGPAELIERIAAFQSSWSVNSAAQAAGRAALEDHAFLANSLPRLWASSDMLRMGLEALGLEVLPSSLPFFLVRVGDGARTRAALLRGGCLVRDCASFGLPQHIRVSPRAPADNRRLLTAMAALTE